MDLLSTLPNFPTKPFSHILPSLEKNQLSVADLVTLDILEIAKRAHVPPADVRRLCTQVVDALHRDLGFVPQTATATATATADTAGTVEPSSSSSGDLDAVLEPGPGTRVDLGRWRVISSLDPRLDALLGGGIPVGYVSEVTGESGSGKTQFLLNLLLSVQLPEPQGISKRAVYISTEAALPTSRLCQLLRYHPYLSSLPPAGAGRPPKPSLANILSINAMDLETQDHILNYQLPVAVARYDVGLVVVDSVTANYRAEHSPDSVGALSARSGELARLGQMLRNLAAKEGVAVVVANQVSDRFESFDGDGDAQRKITGNGYIDSNFSSNRDDTTSSRPPFKDDDEYDDEEEDEEYDNDKRNTTTTTTTTTLSSQHLPSSSPATNTNDNTNTPTQSSQNNADEDTTHPDGTYLIGNPIRAEILSLLHQQRFFTGWGDTPPPPPSYPNKPPPPSKEKEKEKQKPSLKTPTLGLVWSTQIACRIALKKMDVPVPVPVPGPGPGFSQGYASPSAELEESSSLLPRTTTATTTTGIDGHGDVPPASQSGPVGRVRLRRTVKLVFAPWTGGGSGDGDGDEVDFEIWRGGMRSV